MPNQYGIFQSAGEVGVEDVSLHLESVYCCQNFSVVLAGMQRAPFESLETVDLKILSLKTALLTTHFHQEAGGPASIFDRQNIPQK